MKRIAIVLLLICALLLTVAAKPVISRLPFVRYAGGSGGRTVRSVLGTAVVTSDVRLQTGVVQCPGNLGGSAGSVTITFAEPFAQPPVIVVTPLDNSIGTPRVMTGVMQRSTTGAIIGWRTADQLMKLARVDLMWIAVGP